MAIRKMRQKMKPVIFIITIGFFISMLTVIVSNISMGLKNKQYAFKVNGEKVAIQELERGINGVSSQYGQYFQTPIEREDAKILAVDNVITNEILKEIGHDLKVKVSSSEVKTKMSVIESQIPDKDQFKRMLQVQGFTKKTFEKSIEDSILLEKTRDKVLEKVQITDEDKTKEYEQKKYREYLGKTYEEVLPMIEKAIRERKGNEELTKMIEATKRNVKVEDIRENYGNVMPTVEFEEDGFKITNIDILRGALYQSFYGVKDLNEAKTKSLEAIKEEIKLAKIAMDRGMKKDEDLPVMNQIMDLKRQLIEDVDKNIVVDNVELKKFFEENKSVYNIDASVDAKILNFVVKSTDIDEKLAKEKAEKILAEVTPENFIEMAKQYSEGPSAPNGGDLGWFGKGQMIPEFETAAFEGKVGEIYPEVIKSKFGYHIIYVENKKETDGKEEVKASHILIKVVPGEETYAKVMETAKMVAEEIKAKKITFDDASKKEYSKFKIAEYLGIKTDGYIKSLGYEDELSKKIFESDLETVNVMRTEKGIYVFEKVKEVKFEAANFEKVKERVTFDYKNQKLIEEMKKL
jgi:peptidyl-prolyl cis-trans isomerase D